MSHAPGRRKPHRSFFKACRRIAEEATVGKPKHQYVRGPGGGAFVHPQTTRGLYRALKRKRELFLQERRT